MRFLLTAFSAIIHLIVYSQAIIPRFETFGVNEGLSQNSVYAIYQDKEGFMWFGTADGLNRYDGDEIKIYKTKTNLNKRGNSNFIRGRLCEDASGNIWFSTETGIYYYDRLEDEVKAGYLFPELKSGLVYFYLLRCDADNILWIYSRQYGIFSWDIKKETRVNYSYPFQTDFTRLSFIDFGIADPSGNIWISWYQGDGMLRFDTKEKKYVHEFKGKNYQTIVFSKGKYYTGNENFIYRHDSVSSVTDSLRIARIEGTADKNIFSFEDSYGRLWCEKTNQGLVCYDFSTRQFYQYRKNVSGQQSLSSNIIRSLAEDRSGNLWIGTDGAGVCKLDLKPPFFNLFPINEAEYPHLKDFFIKSLYEDERKRVWFGTLSGLNIYNPVDGSIKHYAYDRKDPFSLQGNLVSAIFRDREGWMWIGHDKGISVFDEKRNRFYPVPVPWSVPPRPLTALVNKIMQLNSGDVIILAVGFAVLVRKKNQLTALPAFTSRIISYGHNYIDSRETGKGELWAVIPVSGFYHAVMDNDSLVLNEQFFPGINIRSLHVDKTDTAILWLASDKGLIRFDTKTRKYQHYDESSGKANSFLYGILEDEQHNFWMSTNGGLVYFDRKANAFQNFTVNEGLQSNEFNTGAFHLGASGNFYFGGVKGFNWFRSGSFPKGKTKPSAGITSILVENIPFLKDSVFLRHKTMRLNYLQNDLVFQVAAFDYTRPEANKIQYLLEGWDDKWITTYSKQIRYGKLRPGHYTLIIRAGNYTGEWSDEEKITIIINAPFWQRTWFYIVCGAALLVAVVLITRTVTQRKIKERLRRLEKQQAVDDERNRISKDMHDEIGSGLTRIALMTELMQTQKQLDEKTKEEVSEIAGSTRQLVETMSEIIWALNPQNDRLENLLAYLREQTLHYFEPFDINYRVSFPDQVPDIPLSNEQRRSLFLVTKEALNNALKHSGASHIELAACIEQEKILFSIKDNGMGFHTAAARAGANGIRNMQQRMNEIGGGIEWISLNGKGTEVKYWVPVA
jgi:signal transduction histidine kinase/ligand-binding sensor domain-containing protein